MELEIGSGPDAGSYLVRVVRSTGGGDPVETIRLDVDDLAGLLPLLEASVLSSAVAARRVVPANEAALRDVGERLFAAAFRGEVAAEYRTSAAIAAERGSDLRLALRLTAPELAALPWETLYDPSSGTYLCRREPLVRHVTAGNPSPLAVQPPLRVLAMVSSPRGLPPLDVPAERDRLEEALRPQAEHGLVRLEWLEQASWASVHRTLLEDEWHVLHFIGHGDYDDVADEGVLALVGTDGRADLVPAHALADLLDEAEPTPRLVVLNSCESGAASRSDLLSGTAAALSHSGIHAVVAMQFPISDGAALAFARGFYTALANGRAVDEAVRSGRIDILGTGRGTLEWVTPVLYLRGDDGRLFTRPAEWVGSATPPSDGSGAAPPMAPVSAAAPPPGDQAIRGMLARPAFRWVAGGVVAVAIAAGVLFVLRPWEGAGDGSGTTVQGIGGTDRTVVTVEADADSTESGVWCEAGDRLDITATGEAWLDATATAAIGPDGLADGTSPETRLLESANTGELIGALEDTDEPPFAIGSFEQYICPVDGSLYLGVNDTRPGDNRGSFEVTVTHVPAQ
ncbi:hypothetical protein GCM10017608_01000 [Agromyces luteolus]|nr:hypothetical protein GCM10017608_01000 [Agromyces luteolus]